MYSSIADGWALLKDTVRSLRRYPVLALPLIGAWIINAAVSLTSLYADISLTMALVLFFGLVYSITLASLTLLEMIKQIEWGRSPSILKAIRHVLTRDAPKALPIALVWAFLWFVLAVLAALTKSEDDEEREVSIDEAAIALGGFDGTFSWWSLGLGMLNKILRMVVFTMLPSIAWQGTGPCRPHGRARTSFASIHGTS